MANFQPVGLIKLPQDDRFFEIQQDLKRTLAKGVAENALELALRGRPVEPFYMVGRIGGQSVVNRSNAPSQLNCFLERGGFS